MHPTDELVSLGQVRIARAAADKGVRERRAKALSDLAEMDADYLDAGCEADPWTRLHSAAAHGDTLDPADSLRNRSFGRYAEVLGSATAQWTDSDKVRFRRSSGVITRLREENAASERLIETIEGLP